MKMSGNVRLNTKQVNALNQLLKGETVAKTAETIGVSERQIYRWLQAEDFTAEMRRLKSEMLRMSGVRLVALTSKALKALTEIIEEPGVPGAGVRLRCAVAILELVDKWRVSDDFEERLSILERQVLHE